MGGSQTLQIKLSPAELDKQLLELYISVTKGLSGDVLRVIGGGTDVGKQFLYLQQQAVKRNKLLQLQKLSKNNTVVYDNDGKVQNNATTTSSSFVHDDEGSSD